MATQARWIGARKFRFFALTFALIAWGIRDFAGLVGQAER
jgi:hypothetical protein